MKNTKYQVTSRTLLIKLLHLKVKYFLGVIGIADGCHIRISKPRFEKDPFQRDKFYNRKGFFSWNALGVIDDRLKFIYFSCKHPGNAHDSRIYNESRLKAKLEATYDPNRPRHLIGDKG